MPDPIRKIVDSRYAAQLLAAQPGLAAELASPAPFTRAEMAAALAGSGAQDEAALMRRLRGSWRAIFAAWRAWRKSAAR
jgi:hypothetical protein